MINNFFSLFAKDIGIDLGTVNTLIYAKDRGIVINEPSIVAINNVTQEVIATGNEAKKMFGKTPQRITVSKPLTNGIISDFPVAEKMLKCFIDKIYADSFSLISRSKVVMCIALDLTEVERKAVEDIAFTIGARDVYIVEGLIAAAIGMRLPILEPSAIMIVNIGGGTTDIGVISMGGIVNSKSLKIGGNDFNHYIIDYAKHHFNLFIGEKIAEDIKINIGSAIALPKPSNILMRGRDLVSGLPREMIITDTEVRSVLNGSIRLIIDNIRLTLENTPPELIADVYDSGIILTGGSSLLNGIDKIISDSLKIPVRIAEDPLTTVARGTGMLLDNPDLLKQIRLPSAQ